MCAHLCQHAHSAPPTNGRQLSAQELAAEDALKQERAATAIARMENSAATAQRAKERAAASGLPPCPDGVWGSGNTGLLSAQACYRERDGMMEQKKASGFLVVF